MGSQTEPLLNDYLSLLDDVAGYHTAMDRDDLPRWLTNMASLRAEIDAAAVEVSPKPPAWFIGPWPEVTPNARTHATPNGDLVLMNTGVASAAHVVGACGALLMAGDGRQAADLMWALVKRNVTGEDARSVATTLQLSAKVQGQSQLLAAFAVRYVAGHEFGHIVSGHTHGKLDRGLLDIRRRWAKEGDVLWSQHQELEADTVSLNILQVLSAGNDQVPAWLAATLSLLGPLLILSAHSLVVLLYWQKGRFDVGDGHPPPDVRIASVMEAAPRFAPPEVIESAHNYLEWYEARRRELLADDPRYG